MDDRTKAAYAAATDILKQVITLATALLGFQMVFVKDLSGGVSSDTLSYAWYLLFASIVVAAIVFAALAGELGHSAATPHWEDIYAWYVRLPSGLSIILFAVGLYLTMQAGLQAFRHSAVTPPSATASYPFYWAPYIAAQPPVAAPAAASSPACPRPPDQTPSKKHGKASHRAKT